MKIETYQRSGQALLEIIVAIGVVTVVIVGLVSALTVSLANATYSRNKTQATKYAQEAVEWLRSERDRDWNTFYGRTTLQSYCLNSIPLTDASWNTSQTCGTGVIDDDYDVFSRWASIIDPDETGANPGQRLTIQVIVSWKQAGRNANVTENTVLSKWTL